MQMGAAWAILFQNCAKPLAPHQLSYDDEVLRRSLLNDALAATETQRDHRRMASLAWSVRGSRLPRGSQARGHLPTTSAKRFHRA